MRIGSHVSLKANEYFLGSVNEAISYGSNALMIYTGAPQNTARKPVAELLIHEGLQQMKHHDIPLENLIIHAPYIINLANSVKPETFELATTFLSKEIARVQAFSGNVVVLHPGAHVNAGLEVGLNQAIKGLNMVLENVSNVSIALETMAGKGSEIGSTFEEIAYLLKHVENKACVSVCLDTCHIHDAGYDLTDFDSILDEFDRVIGLKHLSVVHVNDSKNIKGAHKDRHENIGYGHIGFDILHQVITHPKLSHLPKILETPYVDDQPPYRQEIEMIKHGHFIDWKQK
jgi:deoxyribonuclease IV